MNVKKKMNVIAPRRCSSYSNGVAGIEDNPPEDNNDKL